MEISKAFYQSKMFPFPRCCHLEGCGFILVLVWGTACPSQRRSFAQGGGPCAGLWDKEELGLSRDHTWLLLPIVPTGIKKQITAAGWKLGRVVPIEEIGLLAVSHYTCPKCFPETGNFW